MIKPCSLYYFNLTKLSAIVDAVRSVVIGFRTYSPHASLFVESATTSTTEPSVIRSLDRESTPVTLKTTYIAIKYSETQTMATMVNYAPLISILSNTIIKARAASV